ncbi:kinase-like protein, partial [Schizopora paradoxa]
KLAVKRLRIYIKSSDHAKAVASELYIMSKLSHPHIIPFTGFFLFDGFPAIVTPWISGGSLRNAIDLGRLDSSSETALRIAFKIASGLSYLHDKKALHCDIKSDNILLSMGGDPILVDFGLSRLSEYSIQINYSNHSSGSFRWAAKELLGDGACHTKETDVWAYGMVIYEVLTHKVPYFQKRIDIQVLASLIAGEIPIWP